MVAALGIVEIFVWGSTYYLLAVLAEPIIADTGWPRGAVTGGISVGLLAAGAVAVPVGRLIRRRGGRVVLTSAVVLVVAGLALLAAASNVAVYLFAWAVLGVGMGAGLYDAAFATLGRIYGAEARSAITALTLWGGFASTVCWPVSAFLAEQVGWRGTCLAYAALHLVLTLPLCLFALPREGPRPPPAPAAVGAARGTPPLGDPRFWLLVAAGTAIAAAASLWSVHLIAVMQSQGLTLTTAVALGALIGPAQVGARVIEMATGGRHHPIWTALASTFLVAAGFLGLLLGVPAALALVCYGAGNGLWSIARGAVPLAVFGAGEYPAIMGALATPSLLAAAISPYLGALLLERVGGAALLIVLACAGGIALLSSIALAMGGRAGPAGR